MIQNILRTGFSLSPFLVVRNFSSEAKKAVEEELKTGDYDLIHAETFYAMPHIPKTNLPVVLVDQTIEYQVYDHYVRHTAPFFIRPLLAIDVAKLKYWERYYWREASKVIAVSEKDRQEMLAVEPRLDVDIVPNGVNLDLFKKKTSWSSKSPIVMFMGNFNWLQNTEAAMLLIDEIFPIIKKEIKDAKLHIVGQHQPESLLRKASQDILLSNLAEDDIDGIVKANYEASVSASPLRGPGGTRLKVLAAMASKLPIVSSNVGVTGLGVKSGREVIIENDSREMAQAIISILKNPKNAQKLAENAYNFVVSEYDYAVITEKLSQIYLSLKNK